MSGWPEDLRAAIDEGRCLALAAQTDEGQEILMWKVRRTDRLFEDPEGGPVGPCSRCGGAIAEDDSPLLLFVDRANLNVGIYRFCDYCQEAGGIWSHDHVPVILHRTGGRLASEVNVCGECGGRIVNYGSGKWRLERDAISGFIAGKDQDAGKETGKS